jgi:hypothetical protein
MTLQGRCPLPPPLDPLPRLHRSTAASPHPAPPHPHLAEQERRLPRFPRRQQHALAGLPYLVAGNPRVQHVLPLEPAGRPLCILGLSYGPRSKTPSTPAEEAARLLYIRESPRSTMAINKNFHDTCALLTMTMTCVKLL